MRLRAGAGAPSRRAALDQEATTACFHGPDQYRQRRQRAGALHVLAATLERRTLGTGRGGSSLPPPSPLIYWQVSMSCRHLPAAR